MRSHPSPSVLNKRSRDGKDRLKFRIFGFTELTAATGSTRAKHCGWWRTHPDADPGADDFLQGGLQGLVRANGHLEAGALNESQVSLNLRGDPRRVRKQTVNKHAHTHVRRVKQTNEQRT